MGGGSSRAGANFVMYVYELNEDDRQTMECFRLLSPHHHIYVNDALMRRCSSPD